REVRGKRPRPPLSGPNRVGSRQPVQQAGQPEESRGGVGVDRILITGGAGFIGRHVAAALVRTGAKVRILDSLVEQVHGGRDPRSALPADAELAIGDIRNPATVARALKDIDKVVHLAAEVGVGQSMY